MLEKAACASTCFGGSLLPGCEPAAEEAALHAQPDCWVSACSAQGHGEEAMVIPAEAKKGRQCGTQQNLSVRNERLKKLVKMGQNVQWCLST